MGKQYTTKKVVTESNMKVNNRLTRQRNPKQKQSWHFALKKSEEENLAVFKVSGSRRPEFPASGKAT